MTAANGRKYAVIDSDAVAGDTSKEDPSSGSIATVIPAPNGPRNAPA